MNHKMHILVLGSTGFLGGHIARAGFDKGWHIRGLRRDPGASGNLPDIPIEWVEGNLMNPASLLSAMQGVDLIFHAAGYYPKSKDKLGLKAHLTLAEEEIRNVLEAARRAGVKRMVYTSSLSTIGLPPSEETRLADERDFYRPGFLPRNPYYEVKIAMERAVLERVSNDFEPVIVNPTVVLGPGDIHRSSTRFIRYIIQKKVPVFLPVTVNIIDVRDMAAAQIMAAEKGRPGERYILGGHNLALVDALTQVARIAGVQPPRMKIPLGVVDRLVKIGDRIPWLRISSHVKAIHTWQGYNTSKAEQELGLSPRPVAETFRDTIAWLKVEGN